MTQSLLVGLFALAIGAASAAPSTENIALAKKYAPQFRFTKDELYYPSSVEFLLPYVKVLGNKQSVIAQPSPLTAQNLDQIAGQGAGTFLSIDKIDDNAKSTFLRGQKPGVDEPVSYTFIVPKPNNVVDIYYWGFYPFNEGKHLSLTGEVGDHVGDWERMTIRTVNGTAISADYHAHSDTGSTVPWAKVKLAEGSTDTAVAYIAKGSHGVWPTAKDNVYVNAVVFQLVDKTSDDGIHWNSADHLVPISYPDTYTGDLAWMNYKGQWGNQGSTSCWYYFIVKECEVVDGPGSPLRDDVYSKDLKTKRSVSSFFPTENFGVMDGGMSQTIATVSDSQFSDYTIRLDSSAFYAATAGSHNLVAVQQQCSTTTQKSTMTLTTTLSFASLHTAQNEYQITVPACADGSVVRSYRAGLCSGTDAESCIWTKERVLSTYTADHKEECTGAAVKTDDLDNHFWN